jgi:hypothetical protein
MNAGDFSVEATVVEKARLLPTSDESITGRVVVAIVTAGMAPSIVLGLIEVVVPNGYANWLRGKVGPRLNGLGFKVDAVRKSVHWDP